MIGGSAQRRWRSEAPRSTVVRKSCSMVARASVLPSKSCTWSSAALADGFADPLAGAGAGGAAAVAGVAVTARCAGTNNGVPSFGGTLGIAALGSGVGVAGRAGMEAAGVGRAIAADGSEGVRNAADG